MVFHRAFSKLDFLANSAGVHTGMEFGTFKILESLAGKFPTHEIVLAFDRGTSRRKTIDPNYKGNRSPRSDDFYQRSNKLQEILSQIYKTASKDGEEADEVIHSLAAQRTECFIYSNDADLLQSINDERKIQVVKSFESQLYYWDESKVREKYGVGTGLLPIFRSFTGDSTDNIPGVPRINKKLLAEALLFALEHSTADIWDFLHIFKTQNLFSKNMNLLLTDFIDNGRFVLNYQLIKLECFPVQIQNPQEDKNSVRTFLQELEIRSLKICKELGMDAIEEGEEF
jgi:DNA polymerase-1